MPNPASVASAQKTRVFVSYARADMAFADRLAAALEARGIEVLIDRRSLPTLEVWRRELLVLIRKADTVVFIVSPRSIASPVCQWEVEQMAALDKRLAPVVLEPVANDNIPAALTKINYLFFDPPNEFETQAAALALALQTDIAWWHEHSRIVELAGRWDRDGCPEGQLLRRGVITAAQSWASRRPDKAQIPEVVFQLLDASLKKEEHDREELNKLDRRISTERQRLVAEAARRARVAHRPASAMRLALAGEPSEEERARSIAPEPTRRAHLAGAAHTALGVACLAGHSGIVNGAVFSPDAARVMTTSHDNTARIWDAATGAELARLAHGGWARIAVFSPDGARVATGSEDGTARIWDATTGAELVRMAHDSYVGSAAFSPDGSRLATTSRNKLRIWDAATGVELACLAHDRGVSSFVVFSSDGARVISAADKTVRIWDATTGAELVRMAHDSYVGSAAFSPDGSLVATASDNNTARIWDAATAAELALLAHDDEVRSAAFSSDGARVVTASNDNTARIWDVTTGAELTRFLQTRGFKSAAFSPDGARVVTTSGENAARVWDAASGVEVARLAHEDKDSFLCSAEFSPDGARVVTASADETAWVWDVTWAAKLTGEALVRAVARTRLAGEGRLTEEEVRILRPMLGEVDPDVVSRWLNPSPDDAEIEAILAQWRHHSDMALAHAARTRPPDRHS